MFDFLRREGDSSNTIIGIILLVMLLVFAGPNVLPSVLSRTFPFIDEGVPCGRLRTSENRAYHQSLIGRSANDPLSIRTLVSPLPQDPDSTWTIRITVINNTIGTVPILFDESQVIIGDPGSSGVGLIFENGGGNISLPGAQRDAETGTGSFPQENIRLLGPRQRCVHRVDIPANQLGSIQPNVTTVRSYYRITRAGDTQPIETQPPVYADQGLNIIENGIIQSEPVVIPAIASAN